MKWMVSSRQLLPLCVGIIVITTTSRGPAAPGEPTSPKTGTFQIRNKKFGNLLRVEEARRADGTPVVLFPAQNWKCMGWKFSPAGTDAYTLQNLFTGKTIAGKAPAEGNDTATTAVVQVPMSNAPAWKFFRLPGGNYRIDANQNGSLTARSDATSVRVVLEPWKGQAEQEWEVLGAPEKFDM